MFLYIDKGDQVLPAICKQLQKLNKHSNRLGADQFSEQRHGLLSEQRNTDSCSAETPTFHPS